MKRSVDVWGEGEHYPDAEGRRGHGLYGAKLPTGVNGSVERGCICLCAEVVNGVHGVRLHSGYTFSPPPSPNCALPPFPQMASRMTSDEVLAALKKELGGMSRKVWMICVCGGGR